MDTENCVCPLDAVYAIRFGSLQEDLAELKARVAKLETTLMRGVLLLIANLLGVIAMLAHALI